MGAHAHEWTPEEDGYYHCSCGKTKLMSVEDAKAFWSSEVEDAKEESK